MGYLIATLVFATSLGAAGMFVALEIKRGAEWPQATAVGLRRATEQVVCFAQQACAAVVNGAIALHAQLASTDAWGQLVDFVAQLRGLARAGLEATWEWLAATGVALKGHLTSVAVAAAEWSAATIEDIQNRVTAGRRAATTAATDEPDYVARGETFGMPSPAQMRFHSSRLSGLGHAVHNEFTEEEKSDLLFGHRKTLSRHAEGVMLMDERSHTERLYDASPRFFYDPPSFPIESPGPKIEDLDPI